MSFEIKSEDVDVQEIMRSIRKRIEEKRKGLYTDGEIREIAEHKLNAVLSAHEFDSSFLPEIDKLRERWDLPFGPETIYVSSRGLLGRTLETIRRLLRPVQKLFWNPGPMIWAICRQGDINRDINDHSIQVLHVLHNLTVEVTKLNLELQEQKNRVLELRGRLELQARREKTLEDMVVYRADSPDTDDEPPRGGEDPSGGQPA